MKLTNVAAAFCVALALGACSNVDFKKTKGGLPYKLYESKSGTEIEPGNFVKLHLTQKIKDSVTFNTNTDSTMPIYIPVTAAGQPYDFTEILPSMKEGDSLYTVQLVDTFMARAPQQIPPEFKKGDKIEMFVKVIKVFKTQEEVQQDQLKESNAAFDRNTTLQNQLQKDQATINAYLAQNNITAQKTGKGTQVQILSEGTGPQIKEGDFVSVMYTGTTLGGTVFDTNRDNSKGHTEPLEFKVGAPGMIRGFDEGIRMLRAGSKARLFIPSTLAYGPQPPSQEIQPFENLIFDIEVLKVSAQPTQMPAGPGAGAGAGAESHEGHGHD